MICSMIMVLATIVLSFLTFIYIYYTWMFDYWKKRGVPFIKPTPFVGNFGKWISMDVGMMFKDFYDTTKQHPFVGIWVLRKPALVINSPELAKSVLVKDFVHFADRSLFTDRSRDGIGTNTLFFGKNPHWRHMRVKLTPLFSSSKMKTMFELMNEVGYQLKECIDGYQGEPVEVKDTVGRYTTDVIATTAFGLNAHSLKDPNSIFNVFRKKLLVFSFFRSIQFMSIFFYQEFAKLLRSTVIEKESGDWLRDVFWKTVEERKKTKENRNDLIGTLISLKEQTEFDKDLSQYFTGDSLVAQVAAFFLAGNETSSSAITFTLYELALNKRIQDKLSSEIFHVLKNHDNKITYEAIQEMSYLDMCFKETLRLYPALGFLDRECTVPYKIPGTDLVLPKGSIIYIPVQGMHLDSEYFEDPMTYKPERFDKNSNQPIKPFTYYPFGEGPRVCIGERYGTLQVKIGLVHLLKNYSVKTCTKTEIPLIWQKLAVSLIAKNGVYLQFVPK